MNATLAEMLSVLVDATIVANTTNGLESDSVREIAEAIMTEHGVIPFCDSLRTMDPFQTARNVDLDTLGSRIEFGHVAMRGAAIRAAHIAEIDRALFNLRHSAHNTI